MIVIRQWSSFKFTFICNLPIIGSVGSVEQVIIKLAWPYWPSEHKINRNLCIHVCSGDVVYVHCSYLQLFCSEFCSYCSSWFVGVLSIIPTHVCLQRQLACESESLSFSPSSSLSVFLRFTSLWYLFHPSGQWHTAENRTVQTKFLGT